MITIVVSAAFWLAIGVSLRHWLEHLSARGLKGATHFRDTRELLIRRYQELGDEFVAFLVYWGGGTAFFFVCGLALALRGHFGLLAFCLAGATFSSLVIAAALRHGKGTFRNVARLVVFWRS